MSVTDVEEASSIVKYSSCRCDDILQLYLVATAPCIKDIEGCMSVPPRIAASLSRYHIPFTLAHPQYIPSLVPWPTLQYFISDRHIYNELTTLKNMSKLIHL